MTSSGDPGMSWPHGPRISRPISKKRFSNSVYESLVIEEAALIGSPLESADSTRRAA